EEPCVYQVASVAVGSTTHTASPDPCSSVECRRSTWSPQLLGQATRPPADLPLVRSFLRVQDSVNSAHSWYPPLLRPVLYANQSKSPKYIGDPIALRTKNNEALPKAESVTSR